MARKVFGCLAVLVGACVAWPQAFAADVPAPSGPTPQQVQADSLASQARSQVAAKQWNEAIATATKAIEADPKCWAAYLVRGAAQHGKGDFDAALKDCDQVTAQSGRDTAMLALRADAFVQRSRSLYAQGKFLEALDAGYFATLEKSDNFDAHCVRGMAYLARHNYDKAIQSFDRAIQIDPKSAAAYSHRGFAHGAKGRFDQVIADQKKAIELDATLAIAYERRGAALAGKRDFAGALKDIDKAIELDPSLGEALCDRATILRLQGDLARAAVDADAAIKVAPELARAHLQRGLIWAMGKDLERSQKCFEEAVRLDPKSAEAVCGLGQCHLAGKEYEPAIVDFTKALELDGKMMAAYAGRAQAQKKLGALDAYRNDLAKIKELEAAADPKSKHKPVPVSDVPPAFHVVSKAVDPARHGAAVVAAQAIDKLVAANYAKHDVTPMPRTTDAEFVRRIYLDIAGHIPTYKETTAFLGASDPDKRTKLIDELLSSEDFASHSFNYWADVLRYRDQLPGDIRGDHYRQWIKQSLAESKPWDKFVYEMLAADGLIWDNPATGYLQRDPGMPLDNVNNTIRIFLGTRIGCAQCHNHPFDKWTQKQFYQAAAFVYGTQTRTGGGDKRYWEADPNGRLQTEYGKIEQEEEERRKGSYEFSRVVGVNMQIVNDQKDRKVQLPKDYAYSDAKPGDVIEPKSLFGPDVTVQADESPRQAFSRWLTSKENPRFALTIANRLWKQVFGAGQIEPVDDMSDSTVAENPELMRFLETEMKRLDFDMKEYLRILFNTDTYQRQAYNQEVPLGSPYHFPGPILRRMTAEQAWDSFLTLAVAPADYREPVADIYEEAVALDLTKASAEEVVEACKKRQRLDGYRNKSQEKYKYKGILLGRASELPSPLPPNHFLRMFGQSDRELISSSSTGGSVPQVLFMFNGDISHMLLEKNSTIYNNIVKKKNVSEGVKVVFLTILSREPDAEELVLAMTQVKSDGPSGYGNVVWSLVNTREFMFVQ
ncbi:MAG: DUF1549 domain-containing protein [Planctomycetes bacterium]|nr:DUF1549 domain-containing protein [Planctomycetota bacterium]